MINNSVYAFAKNHYDDIFIGTEGEGINVFHAKTGRLGRLQSAINLPPFKSVYRLLFTNIAHEFITPLTLIYAPVQQLLDNSNLDSFSKKYLQTIKNNTDRMKKLIVELLEFRKIKKGHTPLLPESIDIKNLTMYVSDNYVEILKENKIDFQISIGEVSFFLNDREALEKIFFNLFSNAYKYTPRGGYIYVSAKTQSADSLQSPCFKNFSLLFSIRNSGGGLTDEQMREIFDKYKIFNTPKTENTFSTGIGLNLTKSLTEMLRGKIEVNSKLGEYTEFRLAIPSLEESKAGAENSTNLQRFSSFKSLQGLREISAGSHANILIVEDDKNIRELLRDILGQQYCIFEAQDGEMALKSIENNLPDLIISDIVMPKLDGIELIKLLKANARTAHIRSSAFPPKIQKSRISTLTKPTPTSILTSLSIPNIC